MEKDLPHRLERSVLIQADARTVFRFFTDSARWARWWGAGSSIEPRPGGRVSICYPNGARASGEVLAIEAPERLVFTFGMRAAIPSRRGVSRVTIRLEPQPAGTRLISRIPLPKPRSATSITRGGDSSCRCSRTPWRRRHSQTPLPWSMPGSKPGPSQTMRRAARRSRRLRCPRGTLQRSLRRTRIAWTTSWSTRVRRCDSCPARHSQRDGQIRHCQGSVLANWASAQGPGPTCSCWPSTGESPLSWGFRMRERGRPGGR